jgi:hypothetical protein
LKEAQAVMDYRFLSFEKGRFDEAPTYEAASQYQYSLKNGNGFCLTGSHKFRNAG